MIEEQAVERIAESIGATAAQVTSALQFLASGCTIPFIARYRKDATGGLSEAQLENIADGNAHFTGLRDRRNVVIQTLRDHNVLTDELQAQVMACYDRAMLDDIAAPYRKKRRTKATVAREKGLAPLAELIWSQAEGEQPLEEVAATFVRPEKAVHTVQEAIDGACEILAEQVAGDPALRARLRAFMLSNGKLTAHPTKNAEGKKTKYEAYYAFSESLAKIPSHRFLAVMRGVREGVLRTAVEVEDAVVLEGLATQFIKNADSPIAPHIKRILDDVYHQHLRPSIEEMVIEKVQERADAEAVRVFRENTLSLLLSPPAGPLVVMGVAPAQNGGECKAAVVDGTGAVLGTAPLSMEKTEESQAPLLALLQQHGVQAIAVGNGTNGREIVRFMKEIAGKCSEAARPFVTLVSEAGAAAYATSKLGREELPNVDDAATRIAVSLARRLQDPLSELVKVEPRHIGVGQYQHDVNQKLLRDGLHRTLVSAVNRVGVDLNTATAALLRYVSGIQGATAQSICDFRSQKGPYTSRQQLQEVDGVGPRVFEQCAGFLRIHGAVEPLDGTRVHPEAYGIVQQMADAAGTTVADFLGSAEKLDSVDTARFCNDAFGPMALADVVDEIRSNGRDPRGEFKVPRFLETITSVNDLQEGMELEGVVTNVTDFGAFVDIGIQQDGLVHLSELSNRYVQDPREVAKVGEIVRVKVLKVDKDVPRISLSMKALMPELPKSQPRQRPPRPEAREGDAQGTPRPSGGGEGEQPDRGARPERGERRPARREEGVGHAPGRGRSDRGGSDSSRGGNDRRSDRKGAPKRSASAQPAEMGSPGKLSNTLLADQLAAWRDKVK